MKKIIYILLIAFVAFSCKDFDVDEDWVDEAERPSNLAQYEYTMVDADYTTIANGLKANKNKADTLLANQLLAAKKFTPDLDPAVLISYLLEKKYYTADVKSSAKITYMYDDARDEVLSGLSGAGHVLNDADYKLAWGDLYANSLNPEKTPAAKLPLILADNYPAPEDGSYKVLEYNYSTEMSETSIVEGYEYLFENFQSMGLPDNDPVAVADWINKDKVGTKSWIVKSYSGNTYAQVTSYGGDKEKNDNWLITKKISLKDAVDPYLLFDVNVGSWRHDGLSILVSVDFNGNADDILTATWTPITNKFDIPQAPSSGYGTIGPAGRGSLSDFKGKENVYIAFRYEGDANSSPAKTTTYQIDNVKVCEMVVGIDVPNKGLQFASYTYSGNTWKAVGSNIITLQPADYAALGITSNTMTATQAKDLLPQYMRNVIGTEGTQKVIVYRTKVGEFYAERFTFTSGSWVLNSTLSEQNSQFVYAQLPNKKAWIFDPTFIISATKEDYMLMVTYVQDNLVSAENPDLINATYKDSEYYYGFSANYRNITYREKDRTYDTTYPKTASDAEKVAFMNQRTKDGLAILLTLKFPDAQPMVSGVEQFAEFRSLTIYSEPGITQANVYWDYTFQCTGDKEWKFVSRKASDGRSEEAPK